MNRGEILKLTVARRKWAEQPYGAAMLRSIVLAKPFVGGRDIRDFASGGFQLASAKPPYCVPVGRSVSSDD